MDVVALQRSKHYIEGLNKMNQGAAVGVGPGEQCPQHQEAERERQSVGQGAYSAARFPRASRLSEQVTEEAIEGLGGVRVVCVG